MRAGRLKTRRYKIKRSGRGWILPVILLLLLAAGAWYVHAGDFSLLIAPAPTLTPEESAQESRTLTLPGRTWYALQLGVFDREEAAAQLADSYRARGAGAYVHPDGGFRVLAAAYETRSDAQAVQTQLRTLHSIETTLYEISCPEITLRLTGQKAQLTALEDAFDAANQAAEQMSAYSQALDGHTMAAEDIREALTSLRATASALNERLSSLFGPSPHRAVRETILLLSDLTRTLDAALATRGETALGAQIKYGQLLCAVRMAVFAQGLIP